MTSSDDAEGRGTLHKGLWLNRFGTFTGSGRSESRCITRLVPRPAVTDGREQNLNNHSCRPDGASIAVRQQAFALQFLKAVTRPQPNSPTKHPVPPCTRSVACFLERRRHRRASRQCQRGFSPASIAGADPRPDVGNRAPSRLLSFRSPGRNPGPFASRPARERTSISAESPPRPS